MKKVVICLVLCSVMIFNMIAPSIALDFSEADPYKPAGETITIKPTNPQLNLEDGVYYSFGGWRIDGVDADTSGYLLSYIEPENFVSICEERIVHGDVNLNGTVNALDAFTLKRELAFGTFKASYEPEYDVLLDGKINSKDDLALKQMLAGVFDYSAFKRELTADYSLDEENSYYYREIRPAQVTRELDKTIREAHLQYLKDNCDGFEETYKDFSIYDDIDIVYNGSYSLGLFEAIILTINDATNMDAVYGEDIEIGDVLFENVSGAFYKVYDVDHNKFLSLDKASLMYRRITERCLKELAGLNGNEVYNKLLKEAEFDDELFSSIKTDYSNYLRPQSESYRFITADDVNVYCTFGYYDSADLGEVYVVFIDSIYDGYVQVFDDVKIDDIVFKDYCGCFYKIYIKKTGEFVTLKEAYESEIVPRDVVIQLALQQGIITDFV